jgi:hypothetical protein
MRLIQGWATAVIVVLIIAVGSAFSYIRG